MKRITFFNLLYNVIAAIVIAVVASIGFDAPPLYVAAGVLFGSQAVFLFVRFIQLVRQSEFTRHIGLAMAVQKELWESDIAKNLFRAYEWVRRAKDRSANVLAGKVVHIPQAGVKPRSVKNRSVYPIPMIKRPDTDVTYQIAEISTDQVHIPDADKIELSYDKTSSVIEDHFGTLGESSARDILDQWYPSLAANIVRTSGTAVASYLTGSTGNRKTLMIADVETAKTALNLATKKESGDRALILSEQAYNQLKADPIGKNADTKDSVGAVWTNGDLVKIHGFDIIRTDVIGRYDNTATPVKKDYELALAETYAATDNDVVLLVDFKYVHTALGDIKLYETLASAATQGDEYSALVRVGARLERNDQVGVIAIIQTP